MTTAYFYFSAGLSLLLSLWYSASLTTTAANLGYQALLPTAESGYLGLSCAMQVGIAGICVLLAANPGYQRRGLRAAIGFWTASVAYRVVAGTLHWPVSTMTLVAGIVELVLLGIAIVLMLRAKTHETDSAPPN